MEENYYIARMCKKRGFLSAVYPSLRRRHAKFSPAKFLPLPTTVVTFTRSIGENFFAETAELLKFSSNAEDRNFPHGIFIRIINPIGCYAHAARRCCMVRFFFVPARNISLRIACAVLRQNDVDLFRFHSSPSTPWKLFCMMEKIKRHGSVSWVLRSSGRNKVITFSYQHFERILLGIQEICIKLRSGVNHDASTVIRIKMKRFASRNA